MTTLNFNASTVPPDSGTMDALPAGWYNTLIDQTEMKPTRDGSGMYLEVRFNILDGQYAGRKIFDRLNLKNANPVAQEIAYKRLSAICHAVGVMQVQDSQQLHNLPLKVKVKVRPATGEYEASNEVTGIKNINENVGVAPTPSAAPWANTPQAPAQAPAAAPAQQQPWQAPAQPQPPAQPATPPAQAWQPPANAQPWAAAPQQPQAPAAAPQPPAQPAQAPAAPAAAHPAQNTQPPWMQNMAAPNTAGAPAWAQQPAAGQ